MKGLKKHYEMSPGVITPVLKGINLEIEIGEFVAVMGPSGSGKSTLMNIFGTLDLQSEGDYFLEGKAVAELDENALAGLRNKLIGFVFQGFNLLPKRTVLENIALPMLYAGVPYEQRMETAREALAKVGLTSHADYRPTQLSGGQQQRVAIARALSTHPHLLLADEPTGNLDTKTSEEIMDLFRGLHRDRGMTILLVTHEPDIARYAERLIQLKDGEVIYDGDMY